MAQMLWRIMCAILGNNRFRDIVMLFEALDKFLVKQMEHDELNLFAKLGYVFTMGLFSFIFSFDL